MRFAKGCRDVGHVANTEHDRVGVEPASAKLSFSAFSSFHPRPLRLAPLGVLFADCQHVGIDVGDRYLRPQPGHPKRYVAGAAGHVEDLLAGLGFTRETNGPSTAGAFRPT